MKQATNIEIREGMILQCDTLRWDDGWEFECPCLMLAPVIRCWERQMSHEQMVEDVLIDAVVDGKLASEDFNATWGWRGYKLPVLRRRFREALAGKKFPVACYQAVRSTVRIVKDEDGELTWEEVKQEVQK